jgi:HEAT repeat protein
VKALRHPERCVRQCAAEALGFLGDSASIPELIVSLTEDSSEVREQAAKALGRIGNAAALDALRHAAASDFKRYVREASQEAIDRIQAKPSYTTEACSGTP